MLQDLNQLANEAKLKSDNYDKKEFQFSNSFKSAFCELLPNYNIKFYEYTSVVTTSTNLLIVVPNQWFVIGSFFNNYISALKTYKNLVNDLRITKETIKEIRENKTIDEITEVKINKELINENDIVYFKKFLTDYDWWFGSKTIDRGDYFVSSILNLASVIHNSQSYIADLAYTLSEHQTLVEILDEDYNLFKSNSIKNTNPIQLESKTIRQIIFQSFKYVLKEFGDDIVLNENEIKEAKIEDRLYSGLTLNKYFGSEIIVGLFNNEQSSENLKSSGTPRFIDEKITILGNENTYFTSQWNGVDNGRGLTLENFNKLLNDVSKNKLEIVRQENTYRLIDKTSLSTVFHSTKITNSTNTIYYGAPGTGKSFKVDKIIENLDAKYYERITFHPEFDNASFVGGYKPISEKDEDGKDIIKYQFVPQAFTNIYERAWQDEGNQYYLVIEEVNRGNCAEIFGEIFQLLDRDSKYIVTPSKELREYLENKAFKDAEHIGIKNGLKLPPNLSILATMNTSDQSLFPMDSAFKRRWDWEYIPICYKPIDDFKKANESFDYEIDIEDGKKYSWIKFIEKVNLNHIKNNPSLGMDKCIGNYFIKPDKDKTISLKPFINKVIFYLWNDVFKDEENKVFEENTSYEDFFPISIDGKKKIKELFNRIELNPKVDLKIEEDDSQLRQAAEETDS